MSRQRISGANSVLSLMPVLSAEPTAGTRGPDVTINIILVLYPQEEVLQVRLEDTGEILYGLHRHGAADSKLAEREGKTEFIKSFGLSPSPENLPS